MRNSELDKLAVKPQDRSVLQDWVMKLPLREQGTLLTGTRGCDLTPKMPLDSTERKLVAFLRFCFMVPADMREIGIKGAFYSDEPPEEWKASELGHYPQHWYAHLMHCFEVVAYRHPDLEIQNAASEIYYKLVRSLHLIPEGPWEMENRLSEDRIEKDNVVS